VAAFNRGDARAVASHWSRDGEWISPGGQRFRGQQAIRAELESYFAEGQGQRIDVADTRIRFLAPTVAVEEGKARVTRPGEPPSETSYIAIHVKDDGRWKLSSVRETVLPVAASAYGHLKDLAWMIGTWVDRDEHATVETKCEWTKNRNFLTRSFKVIVQDRIELEGTQVIGWDPARRQIRSWVFDSEGGFGEGLWTRRGNRWTVKAHRVLQGGERAAAINVITVVDRDTFTWQSVDREVDGELLPNIDEVTIVRKGSPNPRERR
jgi:uncharacterized protein (TIGR02246 family)